MMENRIGMSLALLSASGSYLCHIDENEYERLQLLFEKFSIPNAGTIAWDKRNPMNAGRGVATQHEYVIWRSGTEAPFYMRNNNIISMLTAAAEIIKKYGEVTPEAQREYTAWVDKNSKLTGGEKANRYLDTEGKIYQSVSLRAPEPRTDPKFHIPLIHPVTGKACPVPPNGFSRTPETLQTMIRNGEIIFGEDESTQPRQKVVLTKQKRKQISSLIQDGNKGKAALDRLGLDFPYCHPVSLYEELLAAATGSHRDIVLDHFAGSGTTTHAIFNLNREDGGKRKYILVEMANYFETVLMPRIKKVVFSDDWKDGKPQNNNGISHFLKYQYLEQYEDALDNLELAPDKTAPKLFGDDYLLKYFLDFETKDNPSLLNIEHLKKPFSYKLKVNLEEVGEPQEVIVDIPETFHSLLGLKVNKVKVRKNKGKKYLFTLGSKDGRAIAIVWREYDDDWTQVDFKRDKDFIIEELGSWSPQIVYVNGQSVLTPTFGDQVVEIRSIEPEFKALMVNSL
jgi:adenine-specific DNA-methyltransferase